MAVDANKIVDRYIEMSKNGGVGTMEPLLSLFEFEGKPLSLVDREPMLPLFKTGRPKRMTVQAGRQVSKTMTIGELGILVAGLNGMQVAIVEPRFGQKKSINDQVLTPLIENCIIRDKIIRPANVSVLDAKKFLSGGQLRLINGFKSADGMRGTSGLSLIMLDESVHWMQTVSVFDFTQKKLKTKKICEILKGDILTSFKDGAILYSVAVRDASFHGVSDCYRVTTSSGRQVVCTSSHLLPTSKGKLRLEEVVDYVYRVSQRTDRLGSGGECLGHCFGGGFHGTSIECNSRVIDGRRLSTSVRESDQSASMESQLQAARVQFAQVPAITRARNRRTCEAGESRLRRLLVSIAPEEFKNAALVVRADSSERQLDEDHNPHIPCDDNTSDSSGVVVHGRRVENREFELRTDSYERIHAGGGGAAERLAAEEVGFKDNRVDGTSQLNRDAGTDTVRSVKNFPGSERISGSILSGMHEVQDRDSYAGVCDVWCGDSEVTQSLLLGGLRENLQGDEAQGVFGPHQRAQECEESRVEGESSRSCSGIRSEIPPESVGGAAGGSSETVSSISGEESGSYKCTEAGMESRASERSYLQETESYLGQELLSESSCGSGEACGVQSKACCIPEGVQQSPGGTRTREGDAASLPCCDKCGSREESKTAGKRSESDGCEKSQNDSRGIGCCQSCRHPEKQGIQREASERSRETSSTQREGIESCSGTVQESYSGRAGEDKCSSAGTSSPESCFGGEDREVEGSIYDEEGFRDSSERVILKPEPAKYFYDPIVNIEYVGKHPVYDIEVVGTHNYILANGICSYNCQDLKNETIPVFEAAADAKVDTGFRIYSGTAKTIDGPLAIKFEQSSQGHWCVKCDCGKWVIFSPDEQLFSTIRDEGCLCPFCSRKINSADGGFVHKFPSRIQTHVGYHYPQTIFPFHHSDAAWREIIYKKNNIPKTQFYNEVLGVSDSDSVRLLTKKDLLNARNNIKSKEQAMQLRGMFNLCVLGVDWGGGGGGESATGVAIIAKNFQVNHFETLYMHRLPTGMTIEQELAFVDRLAQEFNVDIIAHDFTGAGFVRESFFANVYPYWKDKLFPVTYSYKPASDLVTVSTSGSRTSYVVDKTKSLLLTIGCIRHAALTVPWFDPLDTKASQLDFLAIIEHEQKTGSETATGNEVLRGSTVYLLDKVSGVRDDAAQAVNIGFIAACHILGQYPVITFDSKFNMTDAQYADLTGEIITQV